MVMNPEELRALEDEQIRREPVDIKRNFRIFEELYQEAVRLGVFPLKDPLEGIETDIRIARVVNSVPPPA